MTYVRCGLLVFAIVACSTKRDQPTPAGGSASAVEPSTARTPTVTSDATPLPDSTMTGDTNAAIYRRPDAVGGVIAPALGKAGNRVAVEGLPFTVKHIWPAQAKLDKSPWHGGTGTWTFIEAELGGGTFLLGFSVEPAPKAMPDYESGDVWFRPSDAAAADKIVAAFATYLRAEAAPVKARASRAVPGRIGIFGRTLIRNADGSFTRAADGAWTCSKLTLSVDELDAYVEIYFNFDPGAGKGELSEKEPEFRADVMRLIRWAAGA